MSSEILTELLELEIEDKNEMMFQIINNIIYNLDDKEEIIQLYNESKTELKNKFDIFTNKKETFLGGIKEFFRDDEKEELRRYYSILINSSEKMYDATRDEMNGYLSDFFAYRTDVVQQTIARFISNVIELSDCKINSIEDYKQVLEFLSNNDNQLKAINNKINNMPQYQSMFNFTGFEKTEQKLLSKNEESFINGATQGYNLASGACGLIAGDLFVSGTQFFCEANNMLKCWDKESREHLIEYINTAFEYTQIVETVTNEFQNITNKCLELSNKIDSELEKISSLFDLFEPLVADFDNQDKYCNQVFNDLSEQINKIYELLTQEI